MENGFSFELYGTVFENCFILSSRYKNGNLWKSQYKINKKIQN